MARDAAGRYLLDRMDGPDGELGLVAFEEGGALQVGVTDDRGALLAHIGVREPALDYMPFAWHARGWAVAFGGVPPDATRAEVRNEEGDAFPAKIVPFPSELATEDRAAWGLIDRFEDEECLLVGFDEAGRRLTTIGDYGVAPRTTIGEGDDPIGGHWKLWISHLDLGPMLNVRYAWGGSGAGIGKLPGHGFGTGGRGRQVLLEPRRWEVSGLVSSRAEQVEVTTTSGSRHAVVLSIPQREFGPCKAYVAFMPGEEEPLSLTAYDSDGEVLATLDYEA